MSYNLIERLDYTNPVTLPTPSLVLGTATGIGFTGMSQVGNAFNTTISTTNPTTGTLFLYLNSNHILTTISFRSVDVLSTSSVINRILCPRTINIGIGSSGIVLSAVQSGQSYILTITSIGIMDGTVILNEQTINITGTQRFTTASIADAIALVPLSGFSTTHTPGNSTITYTTTAYPFWAITVNGVTLTFACTAPFIASPSTYPYVHTIKQDSAYIVSDPTAQDTLTSSVIRIQSSRQGLNGADDQGAGLYPTVVDPITFLHSTMKNQFYKNLTFSIQQEFQNLIDYANELKTLFNIDYFDGETASFRDKLNAIFSLFAYSAPLTFIPYTNVENGDIIDITKENDFIRNIAKRIWLQRRWAGTLSGYSLLPKFLNRLGAVHLAVQYTTSFSALTGKIYRLLDITQILKALPGGTAYPNSINITGAQNIRQVQATYPSWDTGLKWIETVGIYNLNGSGPGPLNTGSATGIVFSAVTQSSTLPYIFSFVVNSVAGATTGTIIINGVIINITDVSTTAKVASQIVTAYTKILATSGFIVILGATTSTLIFQTNPVPVRLDAPTAFGTLERSLLIEIGLDRVLNHTNSLGTKTSLMDNFFLDALNLILPNVRRARDIVYIGSQLTLITGKDGSFNKLSGSNLYSHPNIQTLFQIMYYKPDKITQAWTGPGAVSYIKIGTGSWGSSVFVDAINGQSPNDTNKFIPTDLANPIFQTQIGQFEKGTVGGYSLINTVIHPRSNSNVLVSPSPILLLNGITTYTSFLQNTYLSFVDQYVTDGSVVVGFQFDNVIPLPNISYSESPTNLVIKSSSPTSASYSLQITGSTAAGGILSLVGASITIGAGNASSVATTITTYFTAGAGSLTGWTVSWSIVNGIVTVKMLYSLLTFHHRILVYEQYNPVASVYDSVYKYQELNSLGTGYVDFADQSLLQGYVTDPLYAPSISNYFPTIQKRLFNFLPLTIADKYPTLNLGQIAKFTFDEGTAGAFSDYAVNTTATPPVLYGNIGAAVNMTTTSGIAGSGYQFNGTTSRAYVTTPVSSMNGLTALSITVFYNDTTGKAQGPSVLVAKESSFGASVGWGLYYVSTASPSGNMLIFEYEQTYASLKWTVALTQAQTIGWHQAIVSFDGISVPSLYLDGVLLTVQQITPVPFPAISQGALILTKTPYLPTVFVFNQQLNQSIFFTNQIGTGVTFSTPIQSSARQFTFTVTSGATGSGTVIIGGVSVSTIIIGDTPTQVASRIAVFSNNNWTAASNGTTVTLTFVTAGGLDTNSTSLFIGAGTVANFFTGILDEITLYNRALTGAEALGSFISTPLKNTPFLSSIGNQQFTYIDHKNGFVVMKLQYNGNGPYGSLAQAALPYSTLSPTTTETYDISVSNNNIGITEMGLFDTSNTLVAYASFPPVIYNAASYHIAFNLLIQQ